MVRGPDEAAHHLRVHELKFARYDVFDPDYFELTFCLPWLGAWMTVPDDEKFLSKQVRAKVRNVWQDRFVVSNVLASHLVGALVIVGGMQAIEFVLTMENHLEYSRPCQLNFRSTGFSMRRISA